MGADWCSLWLGVQCRSGCRRAVATPSSVTIDLAKLMKAVCQGLQIGELQMRFPFGSASLNRGQLSSSNDPATIRLILLSIRKLSRI